MKQEDTPLATGQQHLRNLSVASNTSTARDINTSDYDDGDVLRNVPLPGWTIFDALFISWQDHPEVETSGAAFTDTPIARIQRFRKRFLYLLGALLLFSALSRTWNWSTSSSARGHDQPTSSQEQQQARPPTKLSGLLRWKSSPASSDVLSTGSSLAGYPLSAAYYAAYYNASAPAARIRASSSRITMLQAIAKARSSSYNPSDSILNHEEILSIAKNGGDPMELLNRRKMEDTLATKDDEPRLRQYAVSAVIVHSPDYDISSTQLILDMATKYPFIREVIIWNNDIGFNINENNLQTPTIEDLGFLPPSVRVINSPSSFAPLSSPIHRRLPSSRAKHLACSLATKQHCLFLSPSFLPIHLDSLYTTYLSTSPSFSQIVSVVNAGDYYRLSHYTFSNEDMDLHSGLVQPALQAVNVAAGSGIDSEKAKVREADLQELMVFRDWSRRYLNQIDTLTPEIRGQEDDIYWSLWMNTYPKLLIAPALAIHDTQPLPSVQATPSQLRQARDLVTLDALRTLYKTVSAQDPFLSPDPFPIAPSPMLDTIRTPCHDDRCLFESNISPFGRSASSLNFGSSQSMSKANPIKDGKIGNKANKAANVVGLAKGKKDSLSKAKNGNRNNKGASAFDPFVHITNMEEYEAAWHEEDLSDTASSSSSSDNNNINADFPASVAEFQRQSNWYLAVNGRHPSIKTLAATNSTSCWLTPSNLEKKSYFGLHFTQPKKVNNIQIIASGNLGNMVGKGQEDLTAESWEVWTKSASSSASGSANIPTARSSGKWTRRALNGKVTSVRIGDSALFTHSFTLSDTLPVSHTSQGNSDEDHLNTGTEDDDSRDDIEEVDQVLRKRALIPDEPNEEEDETSKESNDRKETVLRQMKERALSIVGDSVGAEEIDTQIQGIRFISRDRKAQAVRICGFDLDGWII